MKPRKTASYASPEEVIAAWQESETAQHAADRLKMPKAVLLARISKYRKNIPLKEMKRGRPKNDIAALTELAKKHGPTSPVRKVVGPHNSPERVREIVRALLIRMGRKVK